MQQYAEFLERKQDYGSESGFEPLWMPDFLFDFQKRLTEWAIRKGRSAIFADCGLGKTPMQLVWAQNVVQKTNRPVLILTPLAVSGQTLEEADKFGIEARRAIIGTSPTMIQVANYEKLHHFDARNYAGIVCDESSILKNFRGQRKSEITEFMRQVPYRLLCTATAAPNDFIELGTSSEALGYLGHMDMLSRFFTHTRGFGMNDIRRDKWELKGYAQEPFWKWVTSWAIAARSPSDLGFDDDGFILPEMHEQEFVIQATTPAPGMLFDIPAVTFYEERELRRRTTQERCEAAAERVAENGATSMVWCNLNDEGNLLEKLIPYSVQVAGRHPDEQKEEAARWFVHGADEKRVLISKPSIFGFGLNFQHCQHMTYFPTHSYEQYYQASRRLWRFGQTGDVFVDIILTDGGTRIMKNLRRKAKQADEMFDVLVRYMNDSLYIQNIYEEKEVGVPIWLTK